MMKKVISIIVCILLFSSWSQAQITAKGKYKIYNNYQDINNIIIFNGIDETSEISYFGKITSIKWYKFSDLINPLTTLSFTTPQENTSFIIPEDNTGYVVEVDGVRKSFWVIDYQKYLADKITLTPENDPKNQCKGLKINVSSVPMTYKSLFGVTYNIKRDFKLSYQTLEWSENQWKTKDVTIDVTLPANYIQIDDAPLCDTYFILSGDQIAEDFNMGSMITSPFYQAVAVSCKITTTTSARVEKNEADLPDIKSVSGSSPLDILFQGNANVPVATFYNWTLFKDNDLINNRSDSEFRYTFVESGSYKVLLTVNNNYCSCTDSVTVSVSSSAIQVPNVFTPNGDGLNDEFRVAYRSITTFQCWVYNRWGRKVYQWNDPQKGWDGKINGKDAAPGAYFYVIKALGADFDRNSKPDPVTKKRIGEYLLKGDINLLRGVKK